jgi:streptogramin lyase
MNTRLHLLTTAAAVAALCLAAQAANAGAALSGTVSSVKEGTMEGVVVSAKKVGSTIAVSVITNEKGEYSFPADRLDPGHYVITARAAGYDLDGPKATDVMVEHTTTADIKLKPTTNLPGQLTNAEWMMSMTGTDEQKGILLNCNSCHTVERIVKSVHTPDEFLQIFQRMGGYYPGSTPQKPQRLIGDGMREVGRGGDNAKRNAEYLASINLSQQETWGYQLKTLPRLTGKSTHVIITEYDLPNRLIQPHDVMLDREGTVWYSDFGQMYLGKMDPKTGKVTQYSIPETKQGYPVGTLNLEFDHDDNPWIGVMYQSSIAKFDKKTETFKTWSTPQEWDTNMGQLGHLALEGTPVDNKVWIKNSDGGNIYRLDLGSNKMENLGAPKDPRTGRRIGTYGLHSDAANNVYLLDFAAGNIVKIDAKTKESTTYVTPTPNSRPRRGRVDAEGRLWFAEYNGNAIGMFDPKTEKISEWKVPTPWSAPYDAEAGRNGEAWTGSMLTDRVARLDIKTGQYTEYQLPRPTNIRRVHIDDSKKPGILWVGNNHSASIVKVEPLD